MLYGQTHYDTYLTFILLGMLLSFSHILVLVTVGLRDKEHILSIYMVSPRRHRGLSWMGVYMTLRFLHPAIVYMQSASTARQNKSRWHHINQVGIYV